MIGPKGNCILKEDCPPPTCMLVRIIRQLELIRRGPLGSTDRSFDISSNGPERPLKIRQWEYGSADSHQLKFGGKSTGADRALFFDFFTLGTSTLPFFRFIAAVFCGIFQSPAAKSYYTSYFFQSI